jgi:hypothetical protein
MLSLPVEMITVLRPFAPAFGMRVWESAKVLLVGAVLAPGRRTVTSALRVVGVSQERHFTNYYRVLNRDYWSCRALSRILLGLLGHAFAPPAHRWGAASTRRSSGGVGPGSRPKGFIGDRSVTGKEHFVRTRVRLQSG